MTGDVSWVEVLVRMVDGPDLPVHGVVRCRYSDDDARRDGFGWMSGMRPVVLTGGRAGDDGARVWRHGPRLRVERMDGTPLMISDGHTSWRFSDGQPPLEYVDADVRYLGDGTELLERRPATDWIGDDFTRPTGPIDTTVFLGREAWTLDLAPPPHKPFPIRIVVDRETGLLLQSRNDGAGVVDEWVEFEVGGTFDDRLFTYAGPVRSAEERQRQMRAEHEADANRRRNWFRANVSGVPMVVDVRADLSVQYLHTLDERTGAFEATLGSDRAVSGFLTRRPRSDEPWMLRIAEPVHRWSTRSFDWALAVHGVELADGELARLQGLLGGADT
ncbi:hypothetical protein GS485_08510 [Rhodococcus hoagii]|nr:hypothetical protein [Prescottella equi]NKR69146.1 hypothetical protein [Prescottella equi]NKT04819.1 hypothetical protein [Prescottella equi]